MFAYDALLSCGKNTTWGEAAAHGDLSLQRGEQVPMVVVAWSLYMLYTAGLHGLASPPPRLIDMASSRALVISPRLGTPPRLGLGLGLDLVAVARELLPRAGRD